MIDPQMLCGQLKIALVCFRGVRGRVLILAAYVKLESGPQGVGV